VARKHILEGIMKWSQRDQWGELFGEFIEQHLGRACEEMGIDIQDVPDMLEPIDSLKLWRCVFEDLLTADIDGQNLADDYLKRRGWKESAAARSLIRALRQSVMSLYEVSGIRRDEGFFLRDLVRGGEPFWVHEKLATHAAEESDLLATRVVTINGRTEIGGVVLPFDRDIADDLLEQLEQLARTTPDEMAAAFAQLAEEAGETIDEELGEVLDAIKKRKADMTRDEMLAGSAFLFTDFWLHQIWDEELELDDGPFGPDDPEEVEQYDLFETVAQKTRAQGRRR
jgi:hypothetical protein